MWSLSTPLRALLVLWSKRNCFPAAATQQGPSLKMLANSPWHTPEKRGTWNEVNTNSWHSMVRLRSWSASESKFAHLFYWFKRSRTDPRKKNIMHLHKQHTPTPILHLHCICMVSWWMHLSLWRRTYINTIHDSAIEGSELPGTTVPQVPGRPYLQGQSRRGRGSCFEHVQSQQLALKQVTEASNHEALLASKKKWAWLKPVVKLSQDPIDALSIMACSWIFGSFCHGQSCQS